jgi:hypothetical protein
MSIGHIPILRTARTPAGAAAFAIQRINVDVAVANSDRIVD